MVVFHSYVKLPEGRFQGISLENMPKNMVRLRTSNLLDPEDLPLMDDGCQKMLKIPSGYLI